MYAARWQLFRGSMAGSIDVYQKLLKSNLCLSAISWQPNLGYITGAYPQVSESYQPYSLQEARRLSWGQFVRKGVAESSCQFREGVAWNRMPQPSVPFLWSLTVNPLRAMDTACISFIEQQVLEEIQIL